MSDNARELRNLSALEMASAATMAPTMSPTSARAFAMSDNFEIRNSLETTSAVAKAIKIDERAPDMSPTSAWAIATRANADELCISLPSMASAIAKELTTDERAPSMSPALA